MSCFAVLRSLRLLLLLRRLVASYLVHSARRIRKVSRLLQHVPTEATGSSAFLAASAHAKAAFQIVRFCLKEKIIHSNIINFLLFCKLNIKKFFKRDPTNVKADMLVFQLPTRVFYVFYKD